MAEWTEIRRMRLEAQCAALRKKAESTGLTKGDDEALAKLALEDLPDALEEILRLDEVMWDIHEWM